MFSRYWVTADRALCLCGDATRASRRLIGQSDLFERSASLPLKPRAVLNGARRPDKLPTQPTSTASGRFPKGLCGLSELLSFKVRWQWCGPFAFFLRKEVDFLLFEMFCLKKVLAFREKCCLGVLAVFLPQHTLRVHV